MWLVGKLKRCTLEWVWFNPNVPLAFGLNQPTRWFNPTYRATWKHLGSFTPPGEEVDKMSTLGSASPGFKTTQDLCFVALLLSIQLVNV